MFQENKIYISFTLGTKWKQVLLPEKEIFTRKMGKTHAPVWVSDFTRAKTVHINAIQGSKGMPHEQGKQSAT